MMALMFNMRCGMQMNGFITSSGAVSNRVSHFARVIWGKPVNIQLSVCGCNF